MAEEDLKGLAKEVKHKNQGVIYALGPLMSVNWVGEIPRLQAKTSV
jgi:hypothetical protein